MKPKLFIYLMLLYFLDLSAFSLADKTPRTQLQQRSFTRVTSQSRVLPASTSSSFVVAPTGTTRKRQVFDGFQWSNIFPFLNSGDFSLKSLEKASFKFNEHFDRSAIQDGILPATPLADPALAVQHSLAGQQFLPPGFAGQQLLSPGLAAQHLLSPGLAGQHALPPGFAAQQQVYSQVPQFAPQQGLHHYNHPAALQYLQQYAHPGSQAAAYQPQYIYPGAAYQTAYPQAPQYIQQQVPQASALQYVASQPVYPTQAFGHKGQAIYHQQNPYGFRQTQQQQQQYAPPAVKRSDQGRASTSSWFSRYRNRVFNRQVNRNRFRSRNRQKRSLTDHAPWLEVKSRVRRGIFDVITRAFSGKEVVGVLDRMMQDTDDSLYPYTRAALMGYMGSHQTCEQLYPQCPTNTDELIDTFNNLRSFFPNGVPFRDRLPPPLRFLLP